MRCCNRHADTITLKNRYKVAEIWCRNKYHWNDGTYQCNAITIQSSSRYRKPKKIEFHQALHVVTRVLRVIYEQVTLTKLLQCGCLHLCRKIFRLQQTFISFFRRSVLLLQAEWEEGKKTKSETERLFKPDRRVSVFYGSIWTDTKSLKTSSHL